MSFAHPHRKWRKSRGRRLRVSSLTQQTHKNRRGSCQRSRNIESNSRSSDSRRSSNDSFKCIGDTSPPPFQLQPTPKRDLKVRQKSNQSNCDIPAVVELKGAGGSEEREANVARMMENIRLLRLVAEVEKAVGMPSSGLDHPTYLDDGLIAKDGQSPKESDCDTTAFYSPGAIPCNYSDELEAEVNQTSKLSPRSDFPENGLLQFNVDIFKNPEDTRRSEQVKVPTNSIPNPKEIQEELHAERWEYLQQLERRATEASLEGLRKASLKGDPERSQSFSSGAQDTTPSSSSRKFSFSRQRRHGSDRSRKSSSTRNRLDSSNSAQISDPIGLDPKLNPITKVTHPAGTGTDDISKKEKLLLRSPSVSAVPVLQGVPPPNHASRGPMNRPLGPRPMSKISNLSTISDISNQGDEKVILMPLGDQSNSLRKVAQDETEVISIPSSAIKQMVRTSNYLINRKNSANYINPIPNGLQSWNYQDELKLNNSNDDFSQPSLIEISLNKVHAEIANPIVDQPDAPPLEAERETNFSNIPKPISESGLKSTTGTIASDVTGGSSEGVGANRFRRLSIGDGGTIPRDKRYKYMKTHPPLPPYGPSSVISQTSLKETESSYKNTRIHPRVRSVSLGETHPSHQRKIAALREIDPVSSLTSPNEPNKALRMDANSQANNNQQTVLQPWENFENAISGEWLYSPLDKGDSLSRTRHPSGSKLKNSSTIKQVERSKKMYRLIGAKSQSEPSLGFLSSQVHRSGSHHHHSPRKLRKRSQAFDEFKEPSLVPPLPPCPIVIQTLPPPQTQPQPHEQPIKHKNFVSQLKSLWKSITNHHSSHPNPQTKTTNSKPKIK